MKIRTHSMLTRSFGRHVAALVVAGATLALAAGPAPAQSRESTDRDYPVQLTSTEITGAVAPYRDIYYTFVAGPGDVVFTLNVIRESGYGPQVTISLFDAQANTIAFEGGFSSKYVFGLGEANAQGIFRATLSRRQRVLMCLSTKDVREGARFRLRLAGPIAISQPESAAPGLGLSEPLTLPNEGTMRVEMEDGSTHEIDLARVRRVTIAP